MASASVRDRIHSPSSNIFFVGFCAGRSPVAHLTLRTPRTLNIRILCQKRCTIDKINSPFILGLGRGEPFFVTWTKICAHPPSPRRAGRRQLAELFSPLAVRGLAETIGRCQDGGEAKDGVSHAQLAHDRTITALTRAPHFVSQFGKVGHIWRSTRGAVHGSRLATDTHHIENSNRVDVANRGELAMRSTTHGAANC